MAKIIPFVLALLLSGCSGKSGPPVQLIVPKGFTGWVWLLLDPNSDPIPLVNGQYQIVVPANGILRVRDFEPLNRWHSFNAFYDDRTPIPQAYNSIDDFPNDVAVRGGDSGVSLRDGREYRHCSYFIGDAKQKRQVTGMEVPPIVDK